MAQKGSRGAKKKSLKTLDLHGMKKDEVFDVVDRFLHQSSNQSQVRIMPGKGSGKLRDELIKYLKLGGFPYTEEVLDNGKKNPGVLIVFLD